MEQRNLKINKTRGGSGSVSFRISLPTSWIKAMELDNDNQAIVTFDGEQIIIKKATGQEEENENTNERE